MLRTFCFSLYLISFSFFAEASFIDEIKVLTEEQFASDVKKLLNEEDRRIYEQYISELEEGRKSVGLTKDKKQALEIEGRLIDKNRDISNMFFNKGQSVTGDDIFAIRKLLEKKEFKQAVADSDKELSAHAASALIDIESKKFWDEPFIGANDDDNVSFTLLTTLLPLNAICNNANSQLEKADERIALTLAIELTFNGADSPERLFNLNESAEFYFSQLKDSNKAKQILAEAVRICDLCSQTLKDDESFNRNKLYIYDTLANVAFNERDFPLLTNYLEVFLETWPKSGNARSRWIDTREDDLEWIQKWFSKRNWTDLSGKFQITANLQEVKEGGEVILRTADKVDQVILLEQLSKQDQLFVNEFTNQFETPAKDNNPFKVVQNNPVEPMFVIDNNMAGDNPFAAPFAAPNMINFMEESNANEQKILELTKELNRKLGLVDEKLNSVSNLQNKLTEIDQNLSQLQAAGLASSPQMNQSTSQNYQPKVTDYWLGSWWGRWRAPNGIMGELLLNVHTFDQYRGVNAMLQFSGQPQFGRDPYIPRVDVQMNPNTITLTGRRNYIGFEMTLVLMANGIQLRSNNVPLYIPGHSEFFTQLEAELVRR